MFPNQAAVSAVVFFLTLAFLSLLAGFLPVHNVALYGPNDPATTPELIMPDWFLMWVFGLLKLLPGWMSFHLFGQEFSTEFWGGIVLPGLVFLGIFAWPFVDRSDRPVHFTADPLARPWQTAVGIAAVVFVMITSLAGMNSVVARLTGLSTNVINPILQAATLLGPVAAGVVTYLVLRGADEDTGSARPAGGADDD
jgi:cytochrome b-561